MAQVLVLGDLSMRLGPGCHRAVVGVHQWWVPPNGWFLYDEIIYQSHLVFSYSCDRTVPVNQVHTLWPFQRDHVDLEPYPHPPRDWLTNPESLLPCGGSKSLAQCLDDTRTLHDLQKISKDGNRSASSLSIDWFPIWHCSQISFPNIIGLSSMSWRGGVVDSDRLPQVWGMTLWLRQGWCEREES